jgi:hypothetical protein
MISATCLFFENHFPDNLMEWPMKAIQSPPDWLGIAIGQERKNDF